MLQPTTLPMPEEHELAHFASLISERQKNPQLSSVRNTLGLQEEAYLKKLDYHGITLLADANGNLPKSLDRIITQRKAMTVASSVLKQNALVELFDAFHTAQLPCVLFKGSALAHTLYPEPWLRPRTDSDVLINQHDFAKFSEVFEQLGYKKLFAIEGQHISYQSTFSKPLAGQSVMDVDLHWRINNRQSLSKVFDVTSLMKDGKTINQLSTNITAPSHVDSLLISSLHRLGHHQTEERLAWLYDIHLLASTLSATDWKTLTSKAVNKKISAITHDALINCQRWLGTNVPESVLGVLMNSKREPSRIFLQRELPEWRYFFADLKSMPSIGAKFGLIRENLLPSPDYVRQQMNTKSALLAYIKRFIRGVKRVMSSAQAPR